MSGFIVEFQDRWFWTTAGHCLKDLDDYVARAELRVIGGGYIDYLGFEAKHFHVYPYTYEPGDGLYIYRPELGADFAVVPLDNLMQASFQANGVVPVVRPNWVHQHRLSFSFYRMLGVPHCRVVTSTRRDDCANPQVGLAMLAIEELSAADIEHDDMRPGMFAGRIAPGATIETIKGMSGGPIYGFRFGERGELLYHVVAIQSSWLPDKRIVYACPLPEFAERVHHFLAEHGHPTD